MVSKLECESISYPKNEIVIKWKSKFLVIKISETEKERIIEDIDFH